MDKILKIFLLVFKRLKLALILSVVCAVAGFGLFFSFNQFAISNEVAGVNIDSKIAIGMQDFDNSYLSQRLKTYLTETLSFEIFEESKKILTDKLINTDISAIIEIPTGFEQGILSGEDVKLKSTTLDDYENGAYISLYIDSFVNSAAVAAKGADGDAEIFKAIMDKDIQSELTTERISNNVDDKQTNQNSFSFALGFLVMLAGGIGLFITYAVHDDIDYGTFSRMRISHVTGADYMIGTVSASVILNLIVMLPLYIWLITTGQLPESNIFLGVLMLVLFSLFLSAFTILVAIVFKSKQTISVLSGGIISIGCLLGGIWFPIDDSIGAVKYAAYITPHYWFMEEFRSPRQLDSEGIFPIIVVALATLLLFLISAAIFSRKQSVK